MLYIFPFETILVVQSGTFNPFFTPEIVILYKLSNPQTKNNQGKNKQKTLQSSVVFFIFNLLASVSQTGYLDSTKRKKSEGCALYSKKGSSFNKCNHFWSQIKFKKEQLATLH